MPACLSQHALPSHNYAPLPPPPLQSACQIMLNFQAAQRRHLAEGLSLEMLCAVVNNNVRCYDESLEFMGRLQAQLAPHLKGEREGWSWL